MALWGSLKKKLPVFCYHKLFLSFEVIAIHINYGNRVEANAEADFLADWCERHGIIFRLRTITEVKRGVTKRDDYERISRDIRFETYRNTINGLFLFQTVLFPVGIFLPVAG